MSAKVEFVHLHNHSEYSLMDGITRFSDHKGIKGKPSALLEGMAKEGVRAVGLTDHGNMYGAIEFYTQCRKVGIKPIIGCELYLAKDHREHSGSQRENSHLTVLARSFEGYQNLMALSSKAFTDGFHYDPRIDKELLAEHAKGLVVLSGCLKSEMSKSILNGDIEGAVELAGEYKELLEPGAFFLEIMDHGLEKQREVLKATLEINKKTKIPLAATNDCHYSKKLDHAAHDARVCVSTGKVLSEARRLRFESHEFFFKSATEMAKHFHFAPESVTNTVRIAEMCALEIPMGESILPDFPLPEGFTQDSYLKKLCDEGMARLGLDKDPVYRERLDYELGVIRRMGYSGYFLIVWDFIKHAKEIGVPVGPGRGSGAGALVCYCTGITAVDPIRHKLLFERFLNPDRVSMPDLDIDFSDQGRDKIIEYVREKYGHENVAQIITFGSLKARLAIRDVGRIMEVPLQEVDKLAKLIPPGKTINEAVEAEPQLQEELNDPQKKQLIEMAKKLENLKRHTGVHAAGIVITKEPVVKYTPLAVGSRKVVTTQYDGDVLPKLGLLKMDFLGLRNLSVIDGAVRFIHARRDKDFDIGKIPMDDKKTYELLASGKALGVFQLDSEGMRELLRRLKPTTFEDISACIALYRPGPMGSGMLDMFVERKHGKKVRYEHKLMEPILKDTYGCMVYQEQVMEMSKSLAGFSGGDADVLRKAMGKKDPEEMEKYRKQFVGGAKKKDIPAAKAEKIYEDIKKFAGYGFNKSHTVAYGTVAYQTAYLKTNYPVEFFTALLTSEIGHSAINVDDKENKLVTYISDAESLGHRVLGPDVLRSEEQFSIEDEGQVPVIRFGLTAVKNVGHGAAESIVAARREKPFDSLEDICRRVDLKAANKKTLESLIKAGALDALMTGFPKEEVRARLMSSLERTIASQARIKEDIARGQGLLFGDLPPARLPETESNGERVEPWHEHDLLQAEKEVLGFYLSGHPLVRYKDMLPAVSTHAIADLREDSPPKVRLAGMIAQVKKVTTKKGAQMGRGILEDLSGEIPMIVFPKKFSEGLDRQLKSNAIVSVFGRLQFRDAIRGEEGGESTPELIVDEIMPIDMAINRFAKSLTLRFSTVGLEEDLLERLRRVLRQHPGRIPVLLRLDTPTQGQALIETDEKVNLQDRLFDQLGEILGDKSWKIENAS